MAETQKAGSKAAKAETEEVEAEAAAEEETLERTTGQDFEVGSEEALDPAAVAAYEEREDAVEKLRQEQGAMVEGTKQEEPAAE